MPRASGAAEVVSEAASASPAPQAPTAQGAQPVPSAPPAPGAADGDAPAAETGSKHNNGVVRIELSAACVRPGDVLVVTLRTPPKAGLGMVIGYSDHKPHGAMLTGESDANGVYVWRVLVEPSVPDGEATVLVTSTGPNWSREGGGTQDRKFQVARGGC